MFKGILGSIITITILLMFMVPPVFLVLLELGLLFLVTISFWYWLFKIKVVRDLFNEQLFIYIATSLLIAFNAWFIIEIVLLFTASYYEIVQSYFMLSLGLFCFSTPIYLNQNSIHKTKTLLIGIGVMSCALAGGLYFVMYPTSFMGSQFRAVETFVSIGQSFLQLLGVMQEAPIQMY